MNNELSKEFTREENYHALNQMHPTKASRPDGMPPIFFQKYWSIVENSIVETVLHTLNSGQIPPLSP